MTGLVNDLSETARRQILLSLRTGYKSVNQIVEETGLKQPNVSNHLARLRNRNIVKAFKQGRQIFYSLASSEIDSIVQALVSVRDAEAVEVDYKQFVPAYVEYSTSGDEDEAFDLLQKAFSRHSDLLEVYESLLAPAMKEVGILYEGDRISEAQEHMASEITIRCMSRIVHIAGPAKRNGKRCVLGCVPNEWHLIGPRMASDVLRLSGWKTLFCGANVPIRSFLTTVFQNRPDLALIGSTTADSADQALHLVKELCSLRMKQEYFWIGIGGRVPKSCIAELRAAGADFVTGNLRYFATEIVPALEKGALDPSKAWALA